MHSNKSIDSSSLHPIDYLTLKDMVHERILKAITSGELPPGSPVTITQLAEQLGVSLMPVREALRKLEAGGLISTQKNRRIVINEFSPDELKELLLIRLELESMAARKAAKNCTDETIRKLEELMDEMANANDLVEYLQKNREFHHTIYHRANMPILLEVIQGLWLRYSPYLHICVAKRLNYKTQGNIHHEAILRGMRERNPKEVCRSVALDLKDAARIVIEVLSEKRKSSQGS